MEKGLEGNTGLETKVLPKPKADKGMNQSRNNVREGKKQCPDSRYLQGRSKRCWL